MADMGSSGIITKVNRFLHSVPGFDPAKSILAYSGGRDSSTLFHILLQGGNRPGRIVYVNHGLRDPRELDEERKLVVQASAQAHVALTIARIRPGAIQELSLANGIGIEAAAREYRYRAISAIAHRHGLSYVMTAHTSDDLLETLLRRTFSSSSSGGLRGIPASRNLRDGILALRPMLGISRREIDAYILEKKLVVSEDSSNAEDTYQRNKIRKTLKPALGRVFPGWEKGLLGTSSRIAIDGDFVDAASKEAAHKVLSPYKNGFRIPIDNYNSLHRAIRLRLLSQACASCSGRVIPSWRSILEFDKAIFSGSPRIQSAGISIERYDGALIIAPSLDFNAHRRYFFLISKPGIYRNGGYSAVFEKFIPLGATEDSRNAISKNAFVFPFALRTRKPGDQILVDGHSILVDDILKDWKVAPSVRDIVPILEDYNGIFAIMPICLDGYGLLHRKFRSFEGSLGEEGISLILKGVR